MPNFEVFFLKDATQIIHMILQNTTRYINHFLSYAHKIYIKQGPFLLQSKIKQETILHTAHSTVQTAGMLTMIFIAPGYLENRFFKKNM